MIQTETTPNPNSLKFLSEKTISAIGTEEFLHAPIDPNNKTLGQLTRPCEWLHFVLIKKQKNLYCRT